MPNRILRASLRQSKRWNGQSWFHQVFYIRLLTLVDDYGRYECHAQLLANECFPYGDPLGSPIAPVAVAEALRSICAAGLAVIYHHEGNEYIQLLRWKEHARTASKFPEPTKEQLHSKCTAVAVQMITSPPSPSLSPTHTPSAVEECACVEVEEAARTGNVHTLVGAVADKRRNKATGSPLPELKARLCAVYKRPDNEAWPYTEEHALASIAKRENAVSELDLILSFRRRMPSKRYFPQTIGNLLFAWQGTLDRARVSIHNPSLAAG